MAAHDRIRLTGLLRESPASAGLSYRTDRQGLDVSLVTMSTGGRSGLVSTALLAAVLLPLACDDAAPVAPRPETVRDCRSAVYGEEIARSAMKDAVVAGPLTLVIAGEWVDLPARAYAPDATLKVLAIVRAGETVTLVVPGADRDRLSLLYDVNEPGPRRPLRLSDGTRSVRFTACSQSDEWISGRPYPDTRETQFNGGFFVRGAHCAPLHVWMKGQDVPARLWLPLGTAGRPCPADGG
jgi:hypothetical protein